MAKEYVVPRMLTDNSFCPGCGHGVINRMVAETLVELGVVGDAICSLAVGCSCLMFRSFHVDMIQAMHGRAPATATGIKRVRPNNIVFTYQGDGDLSSIGTAEIIQAAARNEKITAIFVNNGVFGMTGGQMAPTTLPGQKTITSVMGRDPEKTGMPLDIVKMIATLPVAYLARGSVAGNVDINKTKRYIRNAFEAQISNEGFSMVEILSPCPTSWRATPTDCLNRLKEEVAKYYPLGEIIKRGGEK